MTDWYALPNELQDEIAKRAVESDKGDRSWALLTRLLRSGRGLQRWQEKVQAMRRPLRWNFTFSPNPADRDPDGDLLASIRVLSGARSWAGAKIDCTVTDANGKCISVPPVPLVASGADTGDDGYSLLRSAWLRLDERFPPGQYTAELVWDSMVTLSIEFCGGVKIGIDSFGSQNLAEFNTNTRPPISCASVPYILPATVGSLDWFTLAKDCTNWNALEYWDVSNVRSMRYFLWCDKCFTGDLSRWRLSEGCILEGAFYGCAASALPSAVKVRGRVALTCEIAGVTIGLLLFFGVLWILALCAPLMARFFVRIMNVFM